MTRSSRLFAWIRWLGARQTLAEAPPDPPAAAPPGPGLRRFLFHPDTLPDATDAPSTARPPFWHWLLTPERLPRTGAAEPPRAES